MFDTFKALWDAITEQREIIEEFRNDDLAFDEAKRAYRVAVEKKTA